MVSKKQRRRQLAREKYERQASRRAEAERAARRRAWITGSVAVLLVVVGVGTAAVLTDGFSGEDDVTAATSPDASPDPSATAGPCDYRTDGSRGDIAAPLPDPGDVEGLTAQITIATGGPKDPSKAGKASNLDDGSENGIDVSTLQEAGTVTVALDPGAPCTIGSWTSLAEQDFFDRTPCHRLSTSATLSVLQCGDPTGTGTGGPGYAFDDENLDGATYPAGTVAMANSGPDTNGSQFFLVYADSTLPPSYTPVGTVVEGLDVVTAIAEAGVATDGTDGPPSAGPIITDLVVSDG